MRPLLPQSKFNFPVLLKLVAIYGVLLLSLYLCIDVMTFIVRGLEYYYSSWERYLFYTGVADYLKAEFVGLDSVFVRKYLEMSWGQLFIPLGAGGILGVLHYIFVRKRRSIIQTIEESLESEVDLK